MVIIVLLWSVGSRKFTVQTGTVHVNLEEEMFASYFVIVCVFFFLRKRSILPLCADRLFSSSGA